MFSHRHAQCISLFAVLLTAGGAVADTFENRPGAECRAVGGAYAEVDATGRLGNGEIDTIEFICPAQRVATDGRFETRFSGRVFALDRHPDEDICCHVLSKNPGGALRTGEERCSDGAQAHRQIIDLPEVVDPYTWSHFAIRCEVPGIHAGNQSKVMTYRVISE